MTPLTPGTPDRGVLYTIHEQGKDADLSFLNTKDADPAAERRYVEAVKKNGAAKRKELADQIRAWNAAQNLDPAKAVERDKTRALLIELQDEMEPRGAGVAETVTEFASERVNNVRDASMKVGRKVGTDIGGLLDTKNGIPLEDKAVTVLKYAAGAMGLYWIGKKFASWWKKSNWLGRVGLFLGGGAAALGGARLIAGTTDRTTGPTLTSSPGPAAAPSVKVAVSPADELPIEDRKFENVNLLTTTKPFIIDGARVQFVHERFSTLVAVDGKAFSIAGKDPIFGANVDLGIMLKGAEMKKNGDYVDIETSLGKRRVSRAEIGKLVAVLRGAGEGKTPVTFETEEPNKSGGFDKKPITLTFTKKGTV